MKDLAYFVYSHSEYSDIWNPCFSRIKKHTSLNKIYLFTEAVNEELPDFVTPIFYDDAKLFSEKMEMCLSQISEKYVIYTHDDNFLRGDVDEQEIERFIELLDSTELSFIHLIRSGVPCKNAPGFSFLNLVRYYDENNLYYLQEDSKQFVGQPCLWKREKFIEVLQNNKAANSTAKNRGEKTRDLESVETHNWMIDNNIRGCFSYNKDMDSPLPPKNITWSSHIFPTMNAIRKGRWYMTEHASDLVQLFKEYQIDPNIRGMM